MIKFCINVLQRSQLRPGPLLKVQIFLKRAGAKAWGCSVCSGQANVI